MARKRVTYRPSKTGSAFGGVVGIIFVLIGLFVIIPTSSMAGGFALIFGVLWTAVAAGITIMNFYQAFGKKYVGPEISIEEDGERPAPAGGSGVKHRLEQLEELKSAGLLTEEEYRQKRAEILGEL